VNRRSFLASLLATAVIDPERLLWVQKKTIFIPPAPVLIDKLYGVDLEYSYVDLTFRKTSIGANQFYVATIIHVYSAAQPRTLKRIILSRGPSIRNSAST